MKQAKSIEHCLDLKFNYFYYYETIKYKNWNEGTFASFWTKSDWTLI